MSKHISQTYQVLDEISHVRKRTGMYAGSTSMQTSEEWVYDLTSKKMEKKTISYIPAFIKIFSEILDNSIDEAKRAPEVLDAIRIEFKEDGYISIQDNGRGIPVEIHPQTNLYIAETIFSNLRAGSNFNDDEDQSLIGTNGVGSTITNILSSNFKVESADGKNLLKIEFWNGLREKSEAKVSTSNKNYTKISFKPDYEFFELDGLDENHIQKMTKKIVDAAANNLGVKFYINGERIHIKSFADYVDLFDNVNVVDSSNEDWKIGISASDGFEQISFINSVETYQGGTHVDYIMWQITEKLKEYFKKKHKVEVKPGDLRSHMRVYISGTVNRPRFSSQTKENMISPPGEWKTSWKVNDKFIRQITQSEIIQSVLDWVKAKEQAQINADLRKHNKNIDKSDPKSVPKFHDATSKNRSETALFLVEGDSALSGVLSGRNSKIHGAFPLRGKPINVFEMDIKEVIENKEFKNIMTILGLQLGVEVTSVNDIRFGKIVFTTDQDLDGYGIRGLLMNMLYKFWPELFDLGLIYILNTPLVKVTQGKNVLSFYSTEEFEEWQVKNKNTKFTSKYYKGLGTSNSKEWKEYFSDEEMEKNLVQLQIESDEDKDMFRLLFSKAKGFTDLRKDWLQLQDNSL